jgi:hypothetical protein
MLEPTLPGRNRSANHRGIALAPRAVMHRIVRRLRALGGAGVADRRGHPWDAEARWNLVGTLAALALIGMATAHAASRSLPPEAASPAARVPCPR